MQTYITNIKLSGIKNIDKEISLDFYKKTKPKKFSLEQSNIKSIYGENGVGKTGIIHAIDIYKKINTQRNYLSDSKTYELLEELVNKVTKSLSIGITFFTIVDEEIVSKLSHEICIQKEGFHYVIAKEVLYEHKEKKASDKNETALVLIENGELQPSSLNISEELKKLTMNLLKERSLLNVILYDCVDRDAQTMYDHYGEDFSDFAIQAILMNSNIRAFLNDTDNHDLFKDLNTTSLFDYSIKTEQNLPKPESQEQQIHYSKQLNYINTNADVINQEDKDDYLKKIAGMSKFIQLFKPDLLDIEVDMKENKNRLICEKYFAYEGYRINIEFESTGIKKLVQLYSAFEYFVEGGIVFIDEFDANIHDVYLSALLEYFTYYAKGQLCFTTHNLGPMEVLRKQKFSIDFLSRDHTITSWKKRGNYSVVNLYREGMIEKSPFNIEPFDFTSIFAANEKFG